MLLTATISNATLYAQLPHEVVGLGRSNSKGDKTPLSTVVFLCPSKIINTGLVRFNSFMVGVVGSRKACRLLCPVDQPNALTAQSLVASGGGLITTAKELVMSQHNYAQVPTKQNPLTISVSTAKQNSLQKQVEIIGYALDSFCIDSNTNAHAILKADTLELVRMLDEMSTVRHCVEFLPLKTQECKTSLFNVLAKGTRRVIADRVTFDKAMQYQGHNDLVIKFAGMVGGAA